MELSYFSILWKFSLENDKNFSVRINSKPKNCVGWIIAFLSRLLSNKEVIGSTGVNLGDFSRPNIYYKIEMKVIFAERFSLRISFAHPKWSLDYYACLRKKNYM